MTHVYEDEFHRLAYEWLRNSYGEDYVHSQAYLSYHDDGQENVVFPDFVVEDDLTTWAIEAERSADKVREGVGQAQEYAAAVRQSDRFESPVTPCVIVPAGHSTGESWARAIVTVKELPRLLPD